jgi:hypothetical protein
MTKHDRHEPSRLDASWVNEAEARLRGLSALEPPTDLAAYRRSLQACHDPGRGHRRDEGATR